MRVSATIERSNCFARMVYTPYKKQCLLHIYSKGSKASSIQKFSYVVTLPLCSFERMRSICRQPVSNCTENGLRSNLRASNFKKILRKACPQTPLALYAYASDLHETPLLKTLATGLSCLISWTAHHQLSVLHEFASTAIELVIGTYYPLQTITCLLFKCYKLQWLLSSEITITTYCVGKL